MISTRTAASYATLAGRMSSPRLPGLSVARAADVLLTWVERTRQRRRLGQLSNHMLKDIGLSRADVEIEAAKPFWRP
jgi:uncharacterized protein YjiS (DUF1127 family)